MPIRTLIPGLLLVLLAGALAEGLCSRQAAAGPLRTGNPAPATARPDTVTVDSVRVAAPFLHRVRPGDTRAGIARRYGLTEETLEQLNGLHGTPLRPGQGLLVGRPDSAWSAVHVARSTDTIFSVARRYGLTPTQLKQLNALASPVLQPGQRLAVPRLLTDESAAAPPAPLPSPAPDTLAAPPAEPPPPAPPSPAPDTLRIAVPLPAPATDTLRIAAPDTIATRDALNVFLDCDGCYSEYLRQQIDFVNYVRDRQDAGVHLLITSEAAGGGRAYTLRFIGRDDLAALRDTLRYTSSSTDTDDERRAGLARRIRLGLVRYLARTPQADRLSVTYDAGDTATRQSTPADDPWNFWVFRVGVNGSYDEQESTDFLRLEGNLSANRVTEAWKLRLSLFGSYSESSFDVGDEIITSTTRNGNAQGFVIRSLGSHWGIGAFASASTSSFNNTDLSISASPAIEYNVFPYAASTSREFRFTYFVNLRSFDYEELTAFGKTSDLLLHHELQATLDLRQPWGSAQLSLEGSTYLYDFDERKDLLDLYRVELFGFAEVRLVRGLSVFAYGGVSWIRDQRFLPAEAASEEDILLGNVRLPTSYELSLSAGLSYTFGSIYNNVVNARFGS